jgi:peroxiredoxin family protein
VSQSKIGIVLVSGSHERLQMAAMVASVAAVSGSEVAVFLSMNALQYFIKGNNIKAPAEGSFGEVMVEKNVPEFHSLFESSVELGDASIYPCSMAMDILNADTTDLEPYLSEPMGLTKFLSDVEDSQIWTF